jgi:hypothetical protein
LGISSSQGLYRNTRHHKHRGNTDIDVSSGVRTHDITVFERAKALYASDRAASVIGFKFVKERIALVRKLLLVSFYSVTCV